MTPSKSSVPSQLLARRVEHAPGPLPDMPPGKSFPNLLSLAGQKFPGAKALERRKPLPNLENRVGGLCGLEPSCRGTSEPGLQVAAVAELWARHRLSDVQVLC